MIVKPKLILNKFTGMNGGNGMYYLDGFSVEKENSSYDNGVGYSGAIDEVIIENRAWTASEVKKYYTNSLGRF